MKKNLKIICVVILLVALLLPITYSYAIAKTDLNVKEKHFFEISKLEVTKNEKVEMTINLDSIKYDEFLFELKSDEVIKNVEITQSDSILAEKNNNEIIMEISKEKTNIKTINLSYEIPENKKVGDTIKFIATITSIVNDETEDTTKNKEMIPNESEELERTNTAIDDTEKVEVDKETVEEIVKTKSETQSIELEVKIIEEKNDNKQDNNKQDDGKQDIQIPSMDDNKQEIKDNQFLSKDNEFSTIKKGTTLDIPTNYSNIQYSGISNVSFSNNQEIKVTYNGSDNNYLSNLSVEGYTLNKEFSKENATYFLTIENEVETLDITATVEDDTATACIYGNENLKEGTNKILISVTAENGNVRNYRIYVTKNN